MVFGVCETKPILCILPGRIRLRMRNTTFARAYVKTSDGIRCFAIEDCGDTWLVRLDYEQGRNLRVPSNQMASGAATNRQS